MSFVAIAYPVDVFPTKEENLGGNRAAFATGADLPRILHASPTRVVNSSPWRIYYDGVKGMAHEISRGYQAPVRFEDVQLALHLLTGSKCVEYERVLSDVLAGSGSPGPSRDEALAFKAQLIKNLWAEGEILNDLAAQGLERLYEEVDKPCLPAVAGMMSRGLPIDVAGLQAAIDNRALPDAVVGFANTIVRSVNPSTSRVCCDFSVTNSATGRITTARPNLQGFPAAVKQFVVAPPGRVFVEADQDQIELRIFADLAGDRVLSEQLARGEDQHRLTAAILLKKSADEISDDERQLGKKFNFAMLYGSTGRGLAKVLGTDLASTDRFLQAFNSAHPALDKWRRSVVAQLHKHGFVRTQFGRVRRLPGTKSDDLALVAKAERQAINTVIQGAAAEIMKLALARLHLTLPSGCNMILTVHDSVLVECPVGREAAVRKRLFEAMSRPLVVTWRPLKVSLKSGTSWGNMT